MSASQVQALKQEIVEKSADGDYVYRGEPECYPQVSSALYRLYEDVDAEHFAIEEVQKEILDKARRYTSATDELEILAELQHHGGKTNLIDFTTDYHIALFFACDGSHDKNGRLILLKETTEQGQIRQPRNPVNRVIAQKSVFVQPTRGFIEPDSIIIIPKDLKQPVLGHLRKYHGISTETIYNDLHGFIKNQGIHQSAYTEFFRGFTSSSKGDESKSKEEQLGHCKKAIMYYDAALKLNPNLIDAYINRGNAKQRLGRYEAAIADYDTVLRLEPQDAAAYANRGVAKQGLGRHEEAIVDYDMALRLNPQLVETYVNRGNVKDDLGLYEAAIADYDVALGLNPQYAVAYYSRGNTKIKLERHEAARADYDTAIRIDPQYTNAYVNRGTIKQKFGHYEEAIADYDAALRLDPQDADSYTNRGAAKDSLGRYEEAIVDHDAAIRLNPQDAAAYYNRGIAKDGLGLYEAAITDYDAAIRLNPQYTDACYNRGNAKGKLGWYEAAITDYDAAIRLNPQYTTAYYGRGTAKQCLGQNEEALSDFKQALALAQQQGNEELARHAEAKVRDVAIPSADLPPSAERTLDALRSTAGAWKGTHDPETLKQAISSDRLAASRPRPKL